LVPGGLSAATLTEIHEIPAGRSAGFATKG
jgi:hypothetical protein